MEKRLLSAPLNDEQVLRGLSRAPHDPPPKLDSQVIDRLLEIRDDPPECKSQHYSGENTTIILVSKFP